MIDEDLIPGYKCSKCGNNFCKDEITKIDNKIYCYQCEKIKEIWDMNEIIKQFREEFPKEHETLKKGVTTPGWIDAANTWGGWKRAFIKLGKYKEERREYEY